MTKALLSILLSGLLFSCRNLTCAVPDITPIFVGFDSTDIDTIIVRKFAAGTNFQQLEDTAIFTNKPSIAGYSTSGDTTTIVLNIPSGPPKYLMPGNDWQVYLPSINVTVSLDNIVSPQRHEKCFGDCWCINFIDSFAQNGRKVVPTRGLIPYMGGVGYLMYIHR